MIAAAPVRSRAWRILRGTIIVAITIVAGFVALALLIVRTAGQGR